MNHTSTKKKEYEERAIVFLDFLGFRNIVNKTVNSKSEFNQLLNTLNKIVNFVTFKEEASSSVHEKEIEELAKFKDTDYEDNYYKYIENNSLEDLVHSSPSDDRRVTVFSDSIIISYPINCMYDLLLETLSISGAILSSGYLVRGGITYGKLYHDERIVFGPAMNKAYDLESKVADVPRIILDTDYLKTADAHSNEEKFLIQSLPFIRTDASLDDYQFIDFTLPVPKNSFPELINRIETDLDEVNSRIPSLEADELKTAKNIQRKLNWVQKLLKEAKHLDN
ncbi:hypothetical protein EXW62_27335 (plasmid) [Bacillus mycoides]|uniref:hypothetical protein n=1 Tax=Bacillus mycoides TaxID=1405 RepID=UPI001C01B9A0|nr:hypothetical protein [Bacillus mycoides]QWH20717.1 hypothetical protein EXW62_27335 [Bacillus mycoides]